MKILVVVICFFCSCISNTSYAEVTLKDSEVTASEFFGLIASDLNLTLNVDGDFSSVLISEDDYSGSALYLLNYQSYLNEFDWFIANNVLTVTKNVKYNSVNVKITYSKLDVVYNILNRNMKFKSTLKISKSSSDDSILISGSKSYISAVIGLIRDIESKAKLEVESDFDVEIIKFNNISVTDKVVFGGITVPGAVTLLQQVLGDGSTSFNLQSVDDTRETSVTLNPFSAERRFVPLQGINSIVVRDLKENIQVIKQIKSLIDVKQKMIEFNIDVFDVLESNYDSVSSELSLGGISFKKGVVNISNIMDISDFSGRFEILKSNKSIESVYRTSVIAMENIPSQIGTSVDMFVPLVSNKTTSLEKITADKTVMITGRVSGDYIMTDLVFNDKTLSEDDDDGDDQAISPKVSGTNITTSFELKTQETIILGGMKKSSNGNLESKTPFLSSIPILGWFFTDSIDYNEANRRYVAITATVKVVK